MRVVTYGGAVSLDGFLAGPDGALDWLHFSPDVQQIMTDYWKGVDTILMGRKTYAAAQTQAGGKKSNGGRPKKPNAGAPRRDTGTKPAPRPTSAPKMTTYVFSRTLETIDAPGVQLVRDDAAAFVRDLKAQPGGHICLMGGGELAQSLIAEGLVDEVGLNIHPLLLGSGIPVFRDPGHRVRFTLEETRPIAGGCVLVRYRLAT